MQKSFLSQHTHKYAFQTEIEEIQGSVQRRLQIVVRHHRRVVGQRRLGVHVDCRQHR